MGTEGEGTPQISPDMSAAAAGGGADPEFDSLISGFTTAQELAMALLGAQHRHITALSSDIETVRPHLNTIAKLYELPIAPDALETLPIPDLAITIRKNLEAKAIQLSDQIRDSKSEREIDQATIEHLKSEKLSIERLQQNADATARSLSLRIQHMKTRLTEALTSKLQAFYVYAEQHKHTVLTDEVRAQLTKVRGLLNLPAA